MRPAHQQLFVQDIPAKLEEVRRLIRKIDIPVRQVLIEARIVEAHDTFGRNLGVRLGRTDLTLLKTAASRVRRSAAAVRA